MALPDVYQEVDGTRKTVQGSYRLAGNGEVAFEVVAYDRSHPLIIDPTIAYSALIGGGTSSSVGYAVTLDAVGNAYIAGYTNASDFPTINARPPARPRSATT